MQVTKRTFLKGLLATAAAGGVVSQASAKPQANALLLTLQRLTTLLTLKKTRNCLKLSLTKL